MYAKPWKLLKKSLVLADRFSPGCFFGRRSSGQAFPSRPSGGFDLEPGDVLSTGTPGGVGHKRKPPVYLKPGDKVRLEITGLGRLEYSVTKEK